MGRWRTRAVAGAVMCSVAVLTSACGQPAPSAAARPAAAARKASASTLTAAPSPAPTVTAAPAPSWPVVLPVPAVPPGLHQTTRRPPARSPLLQAEMTDLWAAVIAGKPGLGLPAFFPKSAYEQVKAIPDPAGDWRNRLVADFRLDVYAAHRLLGRQARHARLMRLVVPEAEANWIPPGACYNAVGYWHVGGARILYKLGGQVRSIGIASLISWRGRWYVVHFGAVLRAAEVGEVDEPSPGEGILGSPGGC